MIKRQESRKNENVFFYLSYTYALSENVVCSEKGKGRKMTERQAREELYSYLHSKRLEENKLEQIEEMKEKLTRTTKVLSDMPKRKF